MAVSDVVADLQSVDNGNYLDIRPAAGVEIIVHNIYVPFDKAIEIHRTDGANPVKVDANTGGYFSYFFHCTHDQYLRVKNASGGTIIIGYDGVQTK